MRGLAWSSLPRVAIVGVGKIGSACANALLQNGLTSHLTLIGRTPERALGEALDLRHANFGIRTCEVLVGNLEACQNADIVVLTACAFSPSITPESPNRRDEFLEANVRMANALFPKALGRDAIVVIVSNPVDLLTALAVKSIGIEQSSRIVGIGTMVDTLRFREALGRKNGAPSNEVEGIVIGEHGETLVPLWSLASVGGHSIAPDRSIDKDLRNLGDTIYRWKGSTAWATSRAVAEVVAAIISNEEKPLTVSTYHSDIGVAASLPCILGTTGVRDVLHPKMSGEERKSWQISIEKLKGQLMEAEAR